MIFSEEEESREVVATSMERRDLVVASAGDEQEVERHGDVPTPRKHAVSVDAVSEWEAKRTRSPPPLVVSPVSSPPAVGTAEQARRSEERVHTHTSSGPALACDPRPGGCPAGCFGRHASSR